MELFFFLGFVFLLFLLVGSFFAGLRNLTFASIFGFVEPITRGQAILLMILLSWIASLFKKD